MSTNDACGAQSPMGYTCNRQPGHHHLPHEHQIEDDSERGVTVIATWPNPQATP